MISMKAYSRDLRLKTLAAIDRGIPTKAVQDLFGVSRSTIKRWLNRRRHTGGRPDDEDPRQALGQGRGLEGVAPPTAEEKPRSYPQGALRGFFGREGRCGLGGDYEPLHCPTPRGWPLKKVAGSLRTRRG